MIAPEFDLPLNIEEVSRSYVIIDYLNAKYCLTCNKETYPQDIAYVLLTDTRPTKEKLASFACTLVAFAVKPVDPVVNINRNRRCSCRNMQITSN